MTTLPADFHELRDRIENEFSDLLAPDLKANGADWVHVVLVSETDLTTCGEFAGLHSPKIHRWLRSYIPKWNGPAPTMLIDDATITNDCGGRWGETKDRFTAIAIHELAHVVCTPGLYARDDDLPDALGDVVRQSFAMAPEQPTEASVGLLLTEASERALVMGDYICGRNGFKLKKP